jgi:hypothetical protein
MNNKHILTATALLLISSSICLAEQKVFTQTVRYVMGENESRQELRELATLEAKRQILEQAGVYLECTTELKQRIRETATGISEETDMQKRVLAEVAKRRNELAQFRSDSEGVKDET